MLSRQFHGPSPGMSTTCEAREGQPKSGSDQDLSGITEGADLDPKRSPLGTQGPSSLQEERAAANLGSMLNRIACLSLALLLAAPSLGQNCYQWIESPSPSIDFGRSVDLDDERLVVGAPQADVNFTDDGAVYVYLRDPVSGRYDLEQSLEPGMDANAQAGLDVAISGDLLVALLFEGRGAAVYRLAGGSWSLEQVLTSSFAGANLSAVATDGERVFVGGTGGVLVFEESGGLWAETNQLSGGVSNHIAISGDFVATSTYIHRRDPLFGGFIQEAYHGLANVPDGFAFSSTGDLYGRRSSGNQYLRRFSRSAATGIWSASDVSGDASRLLPGSSYSHRLAVADGKLLLASERYYYSSYSSDNRVRVLTAAGNLHRSHAESTTRSLVAHGSRFACDTGNYVVVRDLACDPVDFTACRQTEANSTGETGSLIATGSLQTSANDLTLVAGLLPANAFGFFLTSRVSGSTANPGGAQGTLCLAGNIGRYVGPGQIQNSGAAGTISLQLNLTSMPTPTGSVSALSGETWYFQAWHRDVNPTLTSNFTDAVSVAFQ